MSNQRELAQALGVSQGAVSLALRGDSSVSEQLRRRVQAMAKEMNYRPNPYVTSLMAQIRSSRAPSPKGVIALVVDHYPELEWRRHESYRVYFDGVIQSAERLGYRIECFFLAGTGLTAARIDQILHARGIRGLILAPPYFGNGRLKMNWDDYACVGTGYAWEQQQFDRVAHDHDQNTVLAVRSLREHGYRRIGLILPSFYAQGRGTRWLDGYLLTQYTIPEEQRLPLFVGSPEEDSFAAFKSWLAAWQPDALLTLYGHEAAWLNAVHLRVPNEIGLACLIRPPGAFYAGVDDRYAEIGAAAVELVASKISLNLFGIPRVPRLLLIDGQWMDGTSLRAGAFTAEGESRC